MGNFVPWREPAWALLYERMSFLTTRCAVAHEHAPEAVDSARSRIAELTSTIAAQVPAELLPAS